MRLTPPFGYKNVTPMAKALRIRLPDMGDAPPFCRDLHTVPISAAEFPVAHRDYPLVFLSQDDGETYCAVAVLGIREGQNMFVMADGKWDRRTYIPAYVRRYPFCIVTGEEEGGAERSERVVCVDPDALGDEGRPMFDETGEALPHWMMIERLLHEYEDDLKLSEEMCQTFARLQLLEPFTMRAELVGGFTLSMQNLYRVNRERLMALEYAQLRDLLVKGYLEHIYAHLFSQENFQRLLSRRSFFATEPPATRQQYN